MKWQHRSVDQHLREAVFPKIQKNWWEEKGEERRQQLSIVLKLNVEKHLRRLQEMSQWSCTVAKERLQKGSLRS